MLDQFFCTSCNFSPADIHVLHTVQMSRCLIHFFSAVSWLHFGRHSRSVYMAEKWKWHLFPLNADVSTIDYFNMYTLHRLGCQHPLCTPLTLESTFLRLKAGRMDSVSWVAFRFFTWSMVFCVWYFRFEKCYSSLIVEGIVALTISY